MKLSNEQVSKVVNYWGEKLMENTDQGDNAGFEGKEKDMMSILSLLIRNEAEVTEEKVDKFKESLTRILTENELTSSDNLSVDYHPGEFLAQAAEEADIFEDVFPYKHFMMIRNGKIEVKEGYDGKYKELV